MRLTEKKNILDNGDLCMVDGQHENTGTSERRLLKTILAKIDPIRGIGTSVFLLTLASLTQRTFFLLL